MGKPRRRASSEPDQETRLVALRVAEPTRPEDIDPDKPLTDKMKAFVREWSKGESIQNATMRAGYESPAYGYTLVRMPNVLKAYETEKAKYEASVGMTRKRVMEGLLDSIEMAKLMAEPATMVAGWREIGKLCGYYEPVTKKVELTVTGQLAVQRMNQLTDEELQKILESPELLEEIVHEDGDRE